MGTVTLPATWLFPSLWCWGPWEGGDGAFRLVLFKDEPPVAAPLSFREPVLSTPAPQGAYGNQGTKRPDRPPLRSEEPTQGDTGFTANPSSGNMEHKSHSLAKLTWGVCRGPGAGLWDGCAKKNKTRSFSRNLGQDGRPTCKHIIIMYKS